jgi:hypothetical protein
MASGVGANCGARTRKGFAPSHVLWFAAVAALAFLVTPVAAGSDSDGDGFSDAVETYIGTNPLAACNQTTSANDEDPDAWPPDFNDDTAINILDVVALRTVYGKTSGQQGYNRRYDLDANGAIGITDVAAIRPVYDKQCTPPPPPQPTPQPTAQPTPSPTPPPSPPGTFQATFDGIEPASPLSAYYMQNWDVSVHSRDDYTWEALDPTKAQHGADCGAPPTIHTITAYEDAVYNCRNHLMTAMAAEGYGVIYLNPNHMVDFSKGTAVIKVDASTLRTSGRDWWDVYIMPWNDNLKLPLEPFLPDLDGYPRNAISANIGQYNNGTTLGVDIIRNFEEEAVDSCWWCTYESVLTPSPTRRDTFELHISKTHIKFGMPAYNFWPVDEDIPALSWDKGIVQWGHHSYNPTKTGCGNGSDPALAGVSCGDGNTWHWDNFSIQPSIPFTLIRGDRRFVDAGSPSRVNFPAPAPANSFLRFSGTGGGGNSRFDLSFNGGASWQTPSKQPATNADDGIGSYWVPVPQGTTRVDFRGQPNFFVKDFAIFSQAPPQGAASATFGVSESGAAVLDLGCDIPAVSATGGYGQAVAALAPPPALRDG